MKPPFWLPDGLACVASFTWGCIVLVPVAVPPPKAAPRLTVVPAPAAPVKPARRVFMAEPAVPSPLRPVRCARTMLGHCEVRP